MVLENPKKIEEELEIFANNAVGLTIDGAFVKISIVDDASINASVDKVNGEYHIEITEGVFSFLKMLLNDIYFANITDSDLLRYQFYASDGLYVLFDDSSLRNSFMATIARLICFNILYHECGHIVNGHCEKGEKNREMCDALETVSIVDGSKENYNESSKIGFGHQARELIADFWGIRMSFRVFVYAFAKDYSYNLYVPEDFELMRKCLVTHLISLHIMYNLFEKNIKDVDKLDSDTLRNRSHPHPYVRLLYSNDVVKEGLMDIIEENNGEVGPNDSEEIVNSIIIYALDEYQMLLEKMNIEKTTKKLRNPAVIENYITLRKKAVKQSKKHSSFSKFEILKISNEYINQLRQSKDKEI